jgi:tRNA threonylcarbamoyladenosine biosynthesis protein TsaB
MAIQRPSSIALLVQTLAGSTGSTENDVRTLALDTSGRACSIALFENENLIANRHELIGRGHAEWLVPWIAELVDHQKVDHILTGCGPGSFTGVRVAIAAARGLGLAWTVPVHGVNSLALIASASSISDDHLVAIEGGHGELFLQTFQVDGKMSELLSLSPEEGATQFKQHIVVGSGAERLVAVRGYGVAIPDEAQASQVFKVALEQRSLPPLPIYGRGPDAKPSPQ